MVEGQWGALTMSATAKNNLPPTMKNITIKVFYSFFQTYLYYNYYTWNLHSPYCSNCVHHFHDHIVSFGLHYQNSFSCVCSLVHHSKIVCGEPLPGELPKCGQFLLLVCIFTLSKDPTLQQCLLEGTRSCTQETDKPTSIRY